MKNFQVRVENLVGTKEKYEFDEAAGIMRLDFVFQEGLLWPYNYGEILGTLGGDGDKLDAIILCSRKLQIGEIISCRTIGMIELLDRGERDDKIICVPDGEPESVSVSEDFKRRAEEFLMELARQKKKVMKVLAFCGRERAEKEIGQALI